ncbi:NHLP bacteriocin system secretion protein [Granulibacter bethesdensis]|uniref:Type I secretion adaptor protein (HlyD family) n=1 Tax=Granulibacter bethesdensis (strain ATCC BAA-1260 / CGDNIH1) TaxID=391165 RepID=Q0BRX8_GRABC|nr:NHLP bacteriocin system secretion protein [Granulibacter bethesdensis]ABI62424.1 Type I secretion adaptor protein (HlyD family) [Granulibacter bethesdensis CGDNIH1]AHJ68643.1 Type I secretion adaptor protein (HlyD family) [Granulibacter bethesdensis]APH52261.1 Type I secretion adaptor protein (HlyD family) [Granulibacter bethesdensis]APH64954.1 Type I secretion adaptor protein (HlyD family) [Granulibacter bethesdensis]
MVASQSSSRPVRNRRRGLFRQQSLKQLDKPEDFQVPLRVVGPVDWLVGLLCLAFCISIILWSCISRYRETVQGRGILVRTDGMFIGINAPKAGWIDEVVAQGRKVKAHDLVASLATPEEDARIQDMQSRIAQIETQQASISKRYIQRIAVETRAQQRRRDELQESAGLTERRIAEAAVTLSNREYLFNNGAGTIDRVHEARERLFASREALSHTRADLASLDSVLLSLEGQRDLELESIHRQLLELQGQLEQAKLARKLADEIRAPQAGLVALVPVTKNALVAAGQRIITLETGESKLEVLFFVPGDLGKRIEPGMQVRISPTTAPREEYGMLIGKVVSISPHPEGQAEISEHLGNPELARMMAKDGTPFEVRATLELAPSEPVPDDDEDEDDVRHNPYTWTSTRGTTISLSSGQMVVADVTVRQAPPISLVIPALRRWTGL